jgi:hypothetical protein
LGYPTGGSALSYFNGEIDDFRIWNTARSESQIQSNMYTELEGTESGLMAYYNFEEGAGDTLADRSGNGHDGSFMNNPTRLAESKHYHSTEHALSFDGEDYIDINANLTELATQDFTLEAWIKTTGTSVGIIACNDSDSSWESGEKLLYLNNDGKVSFVGYGNKYIYSNTAINDGNWHHIAVIWDYSSDESGESFVYVDGINDSSSSSNYLARNENNSSDTFKIGLPNNNEARNYFDGEIDDVRIWNTALTESEIQANMNLQLSGNENNLVACYNFENGDAIDVTDNAYHGTLNNNIEMSDRGISVFSSGRDEINGILPGKPGTDIT